MAVQYFKVVEGGVTRNATIDEVKAILGITDSVPVPSPTSTMVSTATALQNALNAGDLDITLTAAVTAPSGGINIPRIPGGRVLRGTSAALITRGATTGHVLRSDGTGGSLTLVGIRVDGGWRSNKHEGSDAESNYFLEDYDFLRIDGCVSAYSYRTGWCVGGTKRLEVVNSTLFACPRDTVWEPDVRDYLFEGNLVQHCGDDGWGNHQGAIGNNLVTKSIICRNNVFRDCFGLKLHAGVATGTINGKTSQILIENNTFEACGLYGLYFWEDFGNGEPWAAPRNITVRNNTWKDLRATTQSSGGQVIGVAVLLGFPDTSYDASLVISNNTFVRNAAAQGQTLQSRYSWAQLNSPDKPQNVPGAGSFEGFFTKTGFAPSEVFDLASTGYRNDGGSGSFTHSGNTWTGSWTNTLS